MREIAVILKIAETVFFNTHSFKFNQYGTYIIIY